MKKLLSLALSIPLILTILSFSLPLYAEDVIDSEYYVGLGGSFVDGSFGSEKDDTSWGFNAKAGYIFNKRYSFESDLYVLPGSENRDTRVRIFTFIPAGRITFDSKKIKIVKPYILSGIGLTHAKTTKAANTKTEIGPIVKFGAGTDFFIFEEEYGAGRVSIGFEGSYMLGFNVLGGTKHIIITLGGKYYF